MRRLWSNAVALIAADGRLPLEEAGAAGVADETGATVSGTSHRFANGLGASTDPAHGILKRPGDAAQRSLSGGTFSDDLDTFAER